MSFKEKDFFWIAPLIAMGIGLLPMPYGYYFLSRLVVFISALFFASCLYKNMQSQSVWLFGGIAILYNPIIPIHLGEKSIWVVVNIITAILFLINKNKI